MGQQESASGRLSLFSLSALVIGSMIGAGIFSLPRTFAVATGPFGALIAWSVAAGGMYMLARVFQTLAERKPDMDAGVYAYARAGFGDYAGFLSAFGYWISTCIGNVSYWVLIKSTLGAFFPVVMNTISGARHVSALHLRSAQMLGADRWFSATRVILPSSLPSILVGLRLAMGLSWVLLIVAEMVAVKSGLGYELWNAYYYSRMDVIVAAMATIGVLGFLSDIALVALSSRLLVWHEATDR